ncbi:MAG: hypothetical protein ABIH76_00155, partial [Candidatus Bathyarchaeota archaeon]
TERDKVNGERCLYNASQEKYPPFSKWLTEFTDETKRGPWVWVRIDPSKMTWWRGPRFETATFPISD